MSTTRPLGRTVDERLTPPLLRDLRDDVYHLARGGKLLFAVDAYDIIRYCFPVPPFGSTWREGDILSQADYFASMKFVLDHKEWRPVLLPEYLAEVHAFIAGLGPQFAAASKNDAALTDTLQRAFRDRLGDGASDHSPNALLSVVKGSFGLVLLLVAAARARLGLRELTRLVSTRLTLLTEPQAQHGDGLSEVLGEFAEKYTPRFEFVRRCEAILAEYNRESVESSVEPEYRINDRADATAVDRVIQANVALEAAHKSGRIQNAFRVRLLSSSIRLQRLIHRISDDPLRMPPGHADPSRVVRIPDQIFAYMIASPPSGGSKIGIDAVLDSLEVLTQLTGHRSYLVERGRNDAYVQQQADLLQSYRRTVLSPLLESYENLALFAQAREPLKALLGAAPVQGGGDPSLALIHALVTDDGLARLSGQALLAQREHLRAKAFLLFQWAIGLKGQRTNDVVSAPTRDRIRGGYQALPWLISVPPSLRSIMAICRRAFFEHPDDVVQRRNALAEAFAALLAQDEEEGMNADIAAHVDLVCSVLLLALNDPATEAAAVGLAKNVEITTRGRLRLDALYVLSWAQRRAGDLNDALATADRGLEADPDDPRLWHARALANLALYRAKQIGEIGAGVARSDLESALDHYQAWTFPEEELRTMMIAGCMNGLAYLAALASDISVNRSLDLYVARKWLVSLKDVLPPDNWAPHLPEFFHTEASIEVREASNLEKPEEKKAKLAEALRRAQSAAAIAHQRSDYVKLVADIERKIVEVS